MELSFQTRPVRYLGHILHESRGQEETAEVIVPDSCPDVERIVYSMAEVVLRGRECRSGCLTVSGGIRAAALCVPEDGSAPQKLDAYIPFSLRLDHPAITEKLQIFLNAFVRQVDARLVNSRKILFRVNIGCVADGYEQRELSLYTLENAPEALQLKKQTYPVVLPAETAEKSFSVSDELELPSGKPFVAEVCGYETQAQITDCKVVGSKAVFKGNLCFRLLYLSGDGSVNTWEQRLPFSQYCDLIEDYEQAPLSVSTIVTAAELEPDTASEGRKLMLMVGLTAQCVVSSTVSLELIEDAYAVGAALTPEWTQYDLDCRLDCQTLRDDLRVGVEGAFSSVLVCAAYPDFPYLEQTDGVLRVKAPVSVKLLGTDASGVLQGGSAKGEAMGETALSENAACAASVTLYDPAAQITADGAEVCTDAALALSCSARQELRTLSGGTLEPETEKDTERPAVILRALRAGESIWDIAKQYGTTVRAVTEANRLEEAEAPAEQMLLIPM